MDGIVITHFDIFHQLRQGVENLISKLSKSYKVSILSGDNDKEKKGWKLFPVGATMIFDQNQLISSII
ncbi:MAG: hypothetical protein IPO92_07275 [Saprospiraceae bacterium]|nr:hypothetical protein [Saprospiraceae bacterium]